MVPAVPATDSLNREDPICAICSGSFDESPDANGRVWTHLVNGAEANHDPFHEECLHTWLAVNNTCPYKDARINPNSFPCPSLGQKFKIICMDSGCAALITGAAAVAGAVAGEALGTAGVALRAAAVAVAVAGAVVRVAGAVVRAAEPGEAIAGVAVGTAGVALQAAAQAAGVAEPGEEAAAVAVAVVGIGIAVGSIAIIIFNRLEMAMKDINTIGVGAALGGLTMMNTSCSLPTTVLVSAVATGAFTALSWWRQ